MKIFISAAEASSDAHGAEMLKALRARMPVGESLDAFGIGGPKLRRAGLRTVVDSSELLSMGFVEILGKLPRIFSILKRVSGQLEMEKPDLAVVIDYPDFHMRLAKVLSRLGVPCFYYIPPKLWVWRKARIALLKTYFQQIFCIFPFEEEFYRREGMSVRYVGNPLLDELPLSLTTQDAREQLGLQLNDRVLAILPGSRPSEVSQHLRIMVQAAIAASGELKISGYLAPAQRLQVLMPLPETGTQRMIEEANALAGSSAIDLRISKGDSAVCLAAADAALVKSGTSTLEAALLGCPHAVVYKTGRVTAWIYRKFVRYTGPVGLVNLILQRQAASALVAREILLEDVTVANLSAECLRLLSDSGVRDEMKRKFRQIREALSPPGSEGPSARLAAELLEGVQWQTR